MTRYYSHVYLTVSAFHTETSVLNTVQMCVFVEVHFLWVVNILQCW